MSDPTIQEIKDRLDVVDIIGEYLQLRRSGTSFKALCPFHQEKTPSFHVSRDKGLWKCFGCGEGGDVFAFIQKHEGLSFPEVLKILADRAGVKLPQKKSFKDNSYYNKQAKLREELLTINELSAKFYHQALLRSKSGETGREYLKERGLNSETIKKWQLGFAPDDWHVLENFLIKKGFSKDKLIKAGVLVKNQKGKVYDRFRFRIIFPLVDYHGRVVGFTARALKEEDGGSAAKISEKFQAAKYINSPETPVYNKSKFLYGYYFAKGKVRKNDSIVVVEGNMDVISSHQAGVENVVASSGTALTLEQLNLIRRLTRNITFAFDTDQAGFSATKRGLELSVSEGFNVKIANLEGGKDPDDLIRQDVNLWSKSVESASSFLDFSFNALFGKINDSNKDDLRSATDEYLQVVGLVEDSIVQAQEAKRVAEKLSVPISAIMDELKKKKTGTGAGYAKKVEQSEVKIKPKTRRELLEERILGLSLVNSKLQDKLIELLSVSDFSTVASIAQSVMTENSQSEELKADERIPLLKFLGEEEYARLASEYKDEGHLNRVFADLCKELKGISVRERMKSLSGKIREAEKSGPKDQLNRLKSEFHQLSETLTQISKE